METDSVIISEQSRQEPHENTAVRDILNGSIAGALGKTIEYPFDTIKVRLQTQGTHVFPTTWSCIRYTYRREGILRGFFQGIGSPLCGSAVENAILFVSYNQCARLLEQHTNCSPLQQIILSGAFSGSCASLVLTPVELIKCRLQISNLETGKPVDILPTIKQVFKEGGIRGFWQGQSGTFLRESIGGIAWFTTYESLKKYFLHRHSDNGADGTSRTWELLVSGGGAGLAFNATIFPADTLKSVMQTERRGLVSSATEIIRRSGVAGLYRGLGITLIRAVPANAAVFYTFETLSSMQKK